MKPEEIINELEKIKEEIDKCIYKLQNVYEDNCFTCRYYNDKSPDIDYKCTECGDGHSKWEDKYLLKGDNNEILCSK